MRIKGPLTLHHLFFLGHGIRNCIDKYINCDHQFTRKVFKSLSDEDLAIFALVLGQVTP